jgi:uncharacterized membrane protein
MDKVYEKIAVLLGSTAVILLFALWLVLHTVMQHDYLSFISELAILLGFLILRGQSAQSQRTEDVSKEDLSATKRLNRKVDNLRKEKA